jgi:hypothetical protein
MKTSILLSLCAIPFFIAVSACKQIYDPHLDHSNELLVVEALLTNAVESYYVKLSNTISYSSTRSDYPVTGASVSVTDNTDNDTIIFKENSPGFYIFSADSGTKGTAGHSYTLLIITREGERFESSPEVMATTAEIDSVYGILEQRNVLTESVNDGSEIYNIIEYLNIIADLKGTESDPAVRFKPDWLFEMVDYHKDCIGFNCPPPTYMWKYYLDNQLRLTEPSDNIILREQLAGSMQSDYFKMLYAEQHLFYIVLILNCYHLNKNSYEFYKNMNDQLAADNALFDPIAAQIEGNIYCVSDREKQVLGQFEVSFHTSSLYMVIPYPVSVKPVKNFRGLPEESEGKSEGNPPDWWMMK